ncbi:ImmA/IrrE family metallo-endopeptidase [Thermopolyspora sp. NPDC052614]|uniref:ImmA/IrrE family metallo-endopeptidase n=1 Tax=Thermopolyspora sp. NPDC052614 TaxID=3155682 RepID=UPI0034426F00
MEALALEVRDELTLSIDDPFDPYVLCDKYGVPTYRLDDLSDYECSPEAVEYFLSKRPNVWSAALVPHGTAKFIVENTAHEVVRRRSNVTHELSHLLLEHEFDRILWTDDGCRKMNPQIEKEAAYLAGELLIPKKAAIRAAFRERSNQEVASMYNVSEKFAQWRMDASGARRIAQRSRARDLAPRR